jgi:putative nucleotidyltransferase with HDIG domain
MTESTRVLAAIDSLPTLPIVALQIGEVIHNKNVSVDQVARILRTDPATSAKLLRLVNSSYFGIPGGVADVAKAIPFIGFNTLYQLVLSIGVLESLQGPAANGFDPRALWLHSLTVATAARELAGEIKVADAGACFTAGLLHDMGKIALAKIDPQGFAAVWASMTKDNLSMEAAEKLHGLASHERVGSKLARQWKFPATLATPIEMHHEIHRPEIRDRLAPSLRAITEVVAAADYISQDCVVAFGGDKRGEDGDAAQPLLFERNGFTDTQLTKLRDRTKLELERSKIFLSILETPTAKAS